MRLDCKRCWKPRTVGAMWVQWMFRSIRPVVEHPGLMRKVIIDALGISSKCVLLILCLFQVDEDEPLFLSLINDLFPGLQLDSSTYAELQAAVANQVQLEGLINHPPWNLKLVQVKKV